MRGNLFWKFEKAINFYQSEEKRKLETYQDANGNVIFENNIQKWAKKFQNGRCPVVEVAGPSFQWGPSQNQWIDSESEEDDSRSMFQVLPSNPALSEDKKICPLDRWLENWFQRIG